MSLNSLRPCLEVLACASTILVTAALTLIAAAPPAHAYAVAAVFPPWWSAGEVRLAVDPIGATSAIGRTPTIVTVYGGVDLQQRLRNAGAWLILDPRLLACGPRSEIQP